MERLRQRPDERIGFNDCAHCRREFRVQDSQRMDEPGVGERAGVCDPVVCSLLAVSKVSASNSLPDRYGADLFVLFRLAFAAVSNNVLILSLRAMLADFFYLMVSRVLRLTLIRAHSPCFIPAGYRCLLVRSLGAHSAPRSSLPSSNSFLGFVFALNHLCDGAYSISRISEWLIFIWFGLDGTGLEKSPKFHPLLGPGLITVYAALSNTLLVSLLVSILSTTYSQIAADAVSSRAQAARVGAELAFSAGRRGHVPQSRTDLRRCQVGLALRL